MQNNITENDSNVNMKMDIVASCSYVDSIASFRNMIGDDFTGYADDLSRSAKETILNKAIKCGKDFEIAVETSSDYEDYEDAFMPLRGIDESAEDVFQENFRNLLINYFSLVQNNNATKALSKNIYRMADCAFGNNIINHYDNEANAWGVGVSLRDNEQSAFKNVFEGMTSDSLERNITRCISGVYSLSIPIEEREYSWQHSHDIILPSNMKGFSYLKEFYRINSYDYYKYYDFDMPQFASNCARKRGVGGFSL